MNTIQWKFIFISTFSNSRKKRKLPDCPQFILFRIFLVKCLAISAHLILLLKHGENNNDFYCTFSCNSFCRIYVFICNNIIYYPFKLAHSYAPNVERAILYDYRENYDYIVFGLQGVHKISHKIQI